jgi:hypothetical protein
LELAVDFVDPDPGPTGGNDPALNNWAHNVTGNSKEDAILGKFTEKLPIAIKRLAPLCRIHLFVPDPTYYYALFGLFLLLEIPHKYDLRRKRNSSNNNGVR